MLILHGACPKIAKVSHNLIAELHTCTLSTVCSEDVDVLYISIWLKQGAQLLFCNVPRYLHRKVSLKVRSCKLYRTEIAHNSQ